MVATWFSWDWGHTIFPLANLRLTSSIARTKVTLKRGEKGVTQLLKLEGVGRSPPSLPTQQLAQMAAEAGPSKSGGEELAHKKLCPTMGGKAPQKEFLQAGKVKKKQEVLA